MAEQAGATDQDSGEDLKRQLVQRAAIAGVLAAALLGSLAVFDRLDDDVDTHTRQALLVEKSGSASDRAAPADKAPVSSSAAAAVESAVAVAPPAAEVPTPPPPAAEPRDDSATAAAPATAAETLAAKPPAQTVRVLAEREPQVAEGSGAELAGATLPEKPAQAVPESSGAPDAPPPPEVAAVPAETIPEETGGTIRSSERPTPVPPSTRISHGYLVQVGVFNSPRRAEELHERLRRAGVESRLETRVQVGPFRSRQEAEAARGKLRALGLESLLISPRGIAAQ